MKLLSISTVVPYNEIGHAGGKTYNFYMKKIAEDSEIDLQIIAFSPQKDLNKNDLELYHIKNDIILSSGNIITDIRRVMYDLRGKKTKYGYFFSNYKKQMILNKLFDLKKSGNLPDIIQLEWTEMVLLAKDIRNYFPKVKIIASEHDVSFLKEKRNLEYEPNNLKLRKRYEWMKNMELEALGSVDCIMPQCFKDKKLLIENGICEDRIFVLTPYFHDMSYIIRKKINKDILFWGAMYRPENYEAAIWFIENVMPRVKDLEIRFIVVGNRPPQALKKYSSDKVVITGYVQDETTFFESSMCFVSPLLTGAGVKVKVIEALSAGIPILTNYIGIEGIPATNGQNYYHCEKPEEYEKIIRKIYFRQFNKEEFECSQRKLITDFYNLENSIKEYKDMLKSLT